MTDEIQSELISRLSSYTVVNSFVQSYNSLKKSNQLLKVGLETAESSSHKLLHFSQPVLKKLNWDGTGCMVLDSIETKASNIRTRVSHYYNQSKAYATATKGACRAITEIIVQGILPPSSDDTTSVQTDSPRHLTVIPPPTNDPSPLRRRQLSGSGVCRVHVDAVAYVVELVQYAAHYIDLICKRAFGPYGDGFDLLYLEEDKQTGVVNEIIDSQTNDITHTATKTIVAVVSSLLHASHIVPQLITNVTTMDIEDIQLHLKKITDKTKNVIINLTEADLVSYILRVSTASIHVLHLITELSLAIIPPDVLKRATSFAPLASGLLSWRDSLIKRLGMTGTLNFHWDWNRTTVLIGWITRSPDHKHVLVENTNDFDFVLSLYQSLVKTNDCGPIVVLLTAAKDPETGDVWCTDCIKAKPFLASLNSIPNLTLLECLVHRNEYVDNPNHPYRLHKDIKLTHIPTLIFWQAKGPSTRLVEGELHVAENIEEFKKHIMSHRQAPRSPPVAGPEEDSCESSEEESIEIIFATPDGVSGCVDC